MLNRIARIDDDGVYYEADPRHVEMLLQSLPVGSTVSSPGIREDTIDYDAVLDDCQPQSTETTNNPDASQTSLPIASILPADRSVRFRDDDLTTIITFHDTYSTIYGIHPKLIVATSTGKFKRVSERADPYSGKSQAIIAHRRRKEYPPERSEKLLRKRSEDLNSYLRHGSMWEREAQKIASVLSQYNAANDDYEKNKILRKAAYDSHFDMPELPTAAYTAYDSFLNNHYVATVRTPSSRNKNQKRKGAREVKKAEMHADEHDRLTAESATTYRALAARCNYLAQDRADISFASKELCRDFSAPTIRSWIRLKRLIRYLQGAPRLVYHYACQQRPEVLSIYVDTDFAGCRVTRRSTSGGAAMYGTHCLRHWSTTQPTLALSSGEAELGGLCKGCAQAIGLRSVGMDLGLSYSLRMFSDATAAIAISRRLGIGKIRHLDVSLLWIQSQIRDKHIDLQKILGAQNPSDALTKHIAGPLLREHMERLHLVFAEGRAASAPQLTQASTEQPTTTTTTNTTKKSQKKQAHRSRLRTRQEISPKK